VLVTKVVAVNFAGVVLFLHIRGARNLKSESRSSGNHDFEKDLDAYFTSADEQEWREFYFVSLSIIPVWGPILALMLKDVLNPKND